MNTSLRLSRSLAIALAVAALAPAPANAASRGSGNDAAVIGNAVDSASHAVPALRNSQQDGTTLTAAHRGRSRHVSGHVSIGYRPYRPYYRSHAYVGWPYPGYYGLYGHYAGWWPHYRYPYPYPVEVYGTAPADLPGAVETDVRPGRAEIRVDGELAGQARDFNGNWDVLWLSSGVHELQFSRDGYQTLKVRVDVDGGSYYRIRQRLNKGSGLDPRSRELTAVAETAPPSRPERPRAPAGERSPTPPAEPSPSLARGFLTIEARPGDAAVYLDGKFLANAAELEALHGALPVAEGEHTVEVVRPGYRSVTQRVTVTADEPANVTIRLRRNGDST